MNKDRNSQFSIHNSQLQNPKRILLIEDNPHIMKINSEALALHGYRVLEAETLAEGRTLFEAEKPDLILLDIMLPDGNGLDFCEELRAQQMDTPILFLTAMNENSDIVKGLQAGGDDYITKPYHYDVLLARVEALLRRAERGKSAAGGAVLHCGALAFDAATNRAMLDEKDLLLTPREFTILLVLAQNEGRLVSTAELYKRAWGVEPNDEVRVVRKHVHRLREKLDAAGGRFIIQTQYGQGYVLRAKGG